jgi:hypothetical protein
MALFGNDFLRQFVLTLDLREAIFWSHLSLGAIDLYISPVVAKNTGVYGFGTSSSPSSSLAQNKAKAKQQASDAQLETIKTFLFSSLSLSQSLLTAADL